MNTTCEKEDVVLRALRSGEWAKEIGAHISDCPICSDIAAVEDFLQNDAAQTGAAAALPDPFFVWWRGQLSRKNRALSLATRPMQIVQVLAYFMGAIALIWLAIAAHPWVIEFSASMRHSVEQANPVTIAGLAGCLLCMFAGSAYLTWSEK
jgi:hypothetical protein